MLLDFQVQWLGPRNQQRAVCVMRGRPSQDASAVLKGAPRLCDFFMLIHVSLHPIALKGVVPTNYPATTEPHGLRRPVDINTPLRRIRPCCARPDLRLGTSGGGSDVQCEQLNQADSDHQHREGYRIVIEPMPPLYIHDAPPCSSIHICPT